MTRCHPAPRQVDVWSFACVLECLWTHAAAPYVAVDDPLAGSASEVLRRVENEQLAPSAGAARLHGAPLGVMLRALVD